MSRKQATDWALGAVLVLLTGGVTWAASEIVDHSTRIAVEENNTKNIEKALDRIEGSLKKLLER